VKLLHLWELKGGEFEEFKTVDDKRDDKKNKEDFSLTSPLGKPHPVDIYLGHRITDVRAKAGISRANFATKLDMSEHQLDKFERGVEKIPASLLWYIAVLLEEDFDVFFKDIIPNQKNRQFKTSEELTILID